MRIWKMKQSGASFAPLYIFTRFSARPEAQRSGFGAERRSKGAVREIPTLLSGDYEWSGLCSDVVPVVGLEPTPCRQERILSPSRLPFHHAGLCDMHAKHYTRLKTKIQELFLSDFGNVVVFGQRQK